MAIDDLVNLFTRPPPAQGSSSPALGFDQTPLKEVKKLNPPCIEIASPTTGHGKSHLLYRMITLAVLPPSFAGTLLFGHNSAVLYFDTDGHFSITRLYTVVRGYVLSRIDRIGTERPGRSGQSKDSDIDAMIEASLQHVHIFSPQSMASLMQTLDKLMMYLGDRTRHHSMHRRIHSIMLDSATAFYWNDRYDTDMANVPDTYEEATQSRGKKIASSYPALRSLLSKLSHQLHCPIIYTASDVQPKYSQPATRSLPSALHKSWGTFPDLRLLIQQRPVRGFPLATSAEEAARDAKDRSAAVAEAPFEIVVNYDGNEDWNGETRDIVRTGRGKFSIMITTEGVSLE